MKNIAVLLALLLCAVCQAEAKTPEERYQGVIKSYLRKISNAIESGEKKSTKFLESLKRRNETQSLCIRSRADFNFNRMIDQNDEMFLSFCFDNSGKGIACKAADLTGDNQVNLADIIEFNSEKERSGDENNPNLCHLVKTPTPIATPTGTGN